MKGFFFSVSGSRSAEFGKRVLLLKVYSSIVSPKDLALVNEVSKPQ